MTSDLSRRFRPVVDRLEPILSTSAVPAHVSILPTHGLIDLRSTQITTDLRDSLIRTSPHDGRQGWSLNLIKADPTTRLVYGSVTLLYRARPTTGFFSSYKNRVKLKVDIAFATPLDNPKPGDVKVAVSRELYGFGQNVRNTMALGVIAFLRQDHNLIAAALA